MRVIEAKLQVYKEFEDDIKKENIYLQHVLEDYEEIAKRSAHKEISSFCNIIDLLIKSMSLCELRSIITKSFNQVLTQGNLKTIGNNIFVEYSGEKIGTVHSSPHLCFSKNVAERIKDLLERKIISTISDDINSLICFEITNHIRSQVESDKKDPDFKRFDELPLSIRHLLDRAVTPHFSKLSSFKFNTSDESPDYVEFPEQLYDKPDMSPLTSSSSMAYASSLAYDDSTIDINSRYWREDFANELFCRIKHGSEHVISHIEVTIRAIFKTTNTELQKVYEGLRKCQSGMELVDQKICK